MFGASGDKRSARIELRPVIGVAVVTFREVARAIPIV